MALEIEIKLAVNNRKTLDDLIKFCQSKSTHFSQEIFQKDEYFDTPDGLLRKEDLTVRLRTVENKIAVAIKSPRIYLDDKVHRRVEIELSVSNEGEIRDQIRNHGLIQKTVIEKRRKTYRFDNATVAIDELPFIGFFVEIENQTPEAINEILHILHLSHKDAVRENYTELLEPHLSKLGLKTKDCLMATFEAERNFKIRN